MKKVKISLAALTLMLTISGTVIAHQMENVSQACENVPGRTLDQCEQLSPPTCCIINGQPFNGPLKKN